MYWFNRIISIRKEFVYAAILVCVFFWFLNLQDASGIYNGMNATSTLGQVEDDGLGNLEPTFTRGGANNGPGNVGFYGVTDITIDEKNHRLFAADDNNNRVLVFELDSNNELLDYEADYVLGQSDFTGDDSANTRSGMNTPVSVEYDTITDRLFVAQSGNHRVTVYDFSTTTISNGMDAAYVLGQTTFTGGGAANTQAGMNSPTGLSYDQENSRLYVAQSGNHRVTVYDFSTTTISNGKSALYVLGQSTFTGSSPSNTQVGMNAPRDVIYVTSTSRLYVAQSGNHRVTVYDFSTTTISNGKSALHVLGQTTFTGSSPAVTQTGMREPYGVAYDRISNRLFVSQYGSANRVTVYDMTTTTNGEGATHVLGQSTYTGSTASTSQSGLTLGFGILYQGSSDRLFVADYGNSRVLVFNAGTSTISNGANAVEVIGQYDAAGAPVYSKGGENNGPNKYGFNSPYDVTLDDVGHRLFVADYNNNRVLVFELDSNNELLDYEADYVLGQTNLISRAFAVSQSGMVIPRAVLYVTSTNQLFVADSGNNRVLVYDFSTTTISNGKSALYVLGQTSFTAAGQATTQGGMDNPVALAFDPNTNYLYVAQSDNHRVTVYDVASITNGENAIYVLGQTLFTGSSSATTQEGMHTPTGLGIYYTPTTTQLFVSQSGNHRVTVYDVTSISDGESAVAVLGQTSFGGSFALNTQTGMHTPSGLLVDQSNNRLFVSQSGNNRVTTYDIETVVNGEAATFVLGQSSFTGTGSSPLGQNKMSSPSGMAYDTVRGILHVADRGYNRVMQFDLEELPDVPAVPSVTSFSRQSTSLTMNWGAVSGHSILYTVSSTATSTVITTSSVSVVFSDLIPNTTYYFQIKAVDQFDQDSGYSSVTSSLTTNLSTPSLVNSFQTFSTSTIGFSWNSITGATGYAVSSTATSSLIIVTSTNYTFTGLTPSTTYSFQVQAFDEYDNESSFSSVATGDTYKLTDFVFQQKLTGGDASPGSDAFGYSVDMLGEYIMVGSVANDGSAGTTSSVGAVFAFDFDDTWTERVESPLRAADALSTDDSFGEAVSIASDGNGNTYALIGMDGDDDMGSAAGAAYIFKLVGDTWVEQDKLTASDGGASDFFGREVSLASDSEGEMYALIGATGDDDMGSAAGAAYIFKLVGDTWVEQDKLTASDGASSDAMGDSVLLMSDPEGELYAFVGANLASSTFSSSDVGAVYPYKRVGETWVAQEKIGASDGAAGDFFGGALSGARDDDNMYLIIGATGDDDMGSAAGAAYIFKLVGDTWVEQDKLTASDGGSSDSFGQELSLAFDGRSTIYALISSDGDDDMGSAAGAVYVFRNDGDLWIQESKIHAFDGDANDEFGSSVALTTGPGNVLYALVGSSGDDDLASGAGAVYVYKMPTFPRPPRNIVSTPLGQTAMLISWNDNNNSTSTVYEIFNTVTEQVVSTTIATRYLLTGLTPGSSHQFRVRAKNLFNVNEVTSYTPSSSLVATNQIADAVTMSMPPGIGEVDFQFLSRAHSHRVSVSSITSGVATLVIQSDPVTVSLAAGESENIDTDGNGKNDTTVTMNSVSEDDADFTLSYLSEGSGGGLSIIFSNPPVVSSGVPAVVINNNESKVQNREVVLKFNASNVIQSAISNEPSFNNIPFEPYVSEKKWILSEGNGLKTVFVKLRSPSGETITVSDTILLEDQENEYLGIKSCPLTPEHPYKSAISSSVFYITSDCTRRPIPNERTYFTYFNSWKDVTVVSQSTLASVPHDPFSFLPLGPLYRPTYGALIKTPYDPKVYVLINDTKYWITNETVFTKLNYHSSWIEDVDPRLLDAYQVGQEITRTDVHPAYTLIKYANSPKVYRLEVDPTDHTTLIKRWIVSEDAFRKLNFRGDRIIVVDATEVYTDGEDLK